MVLAGMLFAWSLGAQAAPMRQAFEVASVKQIADRDVLRRRGFMCGLGAGGRFMAFGSMRWVITCAYGISGARAQQELSGGPPWMDDLYEINATAPADNLPRSQSDGFVMLRTLLADRFKLSVHRETREVPAYALVMARRDGRPGRGLHPAEATCANWIADGRRGEPPELPGDVPCGRRVVNNSTIRSRAITLAELSSILSSRLARPVEDRTARDGYFDVSLEWTPEQAPPAGVESTRQDFLPSTDPSGSSIFSALQEQLGLKLESVKGSLEVLVIDHLERPSAN